jgi:hypothetical protein
VVTGHGYEESECTIWGEACLAGKGEGTVVSIGWGSARSSGWLVPVAVSRVQPPVLDIADGPRDLASSRVL